jgi:hypothetical protein
LEELEKDLQPIRALVDNYIFLGALPLVGAFELVDLVNDWINKKLQAWDSWEKEYNSGQRFTIDLFPGGKFLKLIERSRQGLKALKIETEDISSAERECVANISDPRSDGILGEKVNETLEDTPKEDENSLLDVNKSLTQLFRKFRPDKEESPFACSDHEFLEIPYINWAEAKSSMGPFDANGRVTKDWLTELLARFTNDQVCDDQTPCAESSEMELEELPNLAEMHNMNGPTISMPIRTTTIRELGGVLHSKPPAAIEPVDTVNLGTDNLTEINSAGREESAMETPATNAEIPLDGSSGKRTPDVLSKVTENSVAPEDAITSDLSSELVTENGSPINIDEPAISRSQKAGDSEETISNLKRIKAIKEQFTFMELDILNLKQNSVDNNNDEITNKSTTGPREGILLIAKVLYDLVFKLAQMILLGEVRDSLFSDDSHPDEGTHIIGRSGGVPAEFQAANGRASVSLSRRPSSA